MDDYEKYEQDCEKTREENELLLEQFEFWLKKSGLSDKTIKNHSSNINFYINEYLLCEDVIKPEKGVYAVSMFLGYWFIRKAMWASPSSIKSNATSLKKFYSFMFEKKLIDADALDDLKETIKEEMSEWIDKVNRF